MIYIWFGLDGVGIQRSVSSRDSILCILILTSSQTEFHPVLGPVIMVAFAFLGNTLFLTILVSMLSNTFSNISANATAEIQFRRAVLTLEGVKADAVFAYQPPFNILAVFLFIPLKFLVSARWFHKIHVATVRFINLPLLLIIAVAERRLLWPTRSLGEDSHYPDARQWFWQKWHLSVHNDLRAVFIVPPPDNLDQDIAIDDELTHHLIRRQFTRHNTNDSQLKKPSRRDSMFPGISQNLHSSITETDDRDQMSSRLAEMERSMERMEVMLSRLLPGESAVVDDEEDEMEESSTLKDGDGFTTESSFKGQA